MRIGNGTVAGMALLLITAAARAEDFEDEPFSLRFPSAISRFSRYPDVAGVAGASTGAIWGSSPNPAATGWLTLGGTSTQYSIVDFAAGTRIGVVSLTPSLPLGDLGAIQPSVARAVSNRARTREGPEFEFEATSFEIQWGLKVREDTAVGLNLFASSTEVRFGVGGRDASRSRSEQRGVRAGMLRQVSDPLRAGLSIEVSSSDDRSTLYDLTGSGAATHAKDRTGQFAFQPGIAWEYGKSRRVYLDYRYGALHDGEGRLRVHRLLAGVDHEFVPFVNGRAGLALDNRGYASPTLGIGLYPSESVVLDLSFQADMFPELRREFGRSRTLGLALSINF